ncbi:hypothetical protein PybrP1_011224, partial [[Pythium] brassicae (nom. inval.)]
SACAAKQVVYSFERATAAGVDGALTVRHSEGDSAAAWLLASLDFSTLAIDAVRAADPQCAQLVGAPQFQYHIHVDWQNASRASGSFAECAKSATGNHYDPDFACGPASEHVGSAACAEKTPKYNCSPVRYAQDPSVCEKGDLSGKVGNLVVGPNGFASGEWKDPHFPLYHERRPHWSIVLHAVCGSATPRIACAMGIEGDAPTLQETGDEAAAAAEGDYTGEYDESYDWVDELRA